MTQYKVDIGLEVHVELDTRTKMFCGCAVVDPILAKPNSSVCPVCSGMPGVLPVVNKQAVALAIKAALALHCQVAETSIFARKNYFYPDLPKGYQISQYENPLAEHGWLLIESEQKEKKVRIRRTHLEEDTGKLSHYSPNGEEYSLVDLNRCGVPLLEIVSEPDMHSAQDAVQYSYTLRHLLRFLGVSTGDMEKGAMRFEANVSLRPKGNRTLGTRVEIKNLNSIRAMQQAIQYEIARQERLLKQGKSITQQTLGWDELSAKTVLQRSKEEAHDYRYFPEPDLPPLKIEKEWLEEIAASMPELPYEKRKRYARDFALPAADIERLIDEPQIAQYFELCLAQKSNVSAKSIANWILGELFSWMNQSGQTIDALKTKPDRLMALLELLEKGKINNATAKEVLYAMLHTGKAAAEIIQERGLEQISDAQTINALISKVLQENPLELQSFLAGKETLEQWFFGQVVAAAESKANPQLVKKLLHQALEAKKPD